MPNTEELPRVGLNGSATRPEVPNSDNSEPHRMASRTALKLSPTACVYRASIVSTRWPTISARSASFTPAARRWGDVAVAALVGTDVLAGGFLGRSPEVEVEVALAPHAAGWGREEEIAVLAVEVDLGFGHPGKVAGQDTRPAPCSCSAAIRRS